VSAGAHVAPLQESRVLTTPPMRDCDTRAAAMTSGGGQAPLFAALPRDVAALARVVQGLLRHAHWAPADGVALSDERRSESPIRPTTRRLDHLLAHDGRPLAVGRPVGARLVGVCRHFTVLLVALWRAQEVPARARCGFGAYGHPGHVADHGVCEDWHAAAAGWVLVDAPIDARQRAKLHPDCDGRDGPRARVVSAGDARAPCRAGAADPSTVGRCARRGLWCIAGTLRRDVAALTQREMLPWEVWGAMSRPDEPPQNEQLALFDRLAAVTRAPDAACAALRARYAGDERRRVPATVCNSVLNRPETL
jgi:hypothetical protein